MLKGVITESFTCLCTVHCTGIHSIHSQTETHTQTAHTVTSLWDKALKWRAGHNFTAASGASSEVKMSTALGDFNLPWCYWSAGSLASAQSNLQCNPQPDCFSSTTICTHCPNHFAAEKSTEVVREARFCHLAPSGAVLLNSDCLKV